MTYKMTFCILLFSLSFYSYGQEQTGKATYYAQKFAGRSTASGEKFKPNKYTAAHRSLPFGTKVKVTNMANHKSVVVRINDRGPFTKDRIIDLSPIAAKKLQFIRQGVARVKIKVVDNDIPLGEIK